MRAAIIVAAVAALAAGCGSKSADDPFTADMKGALERAKLARCALLDMW